MARVLVIKHDNNKSFYIKTQNPRERVGRCSGAVFVIKKKLIAREVRITQFDNSEKILNIIL